MSGKMRKHSLTSRWPRHDPIFRFSAPPGLALPDYWRNELLYRGGDIERHVLVQVGLPTTALRYDVAVSEMEEHLRVKSRHEFGDRLSHGLTDIQNEILSAMRLFASSWLPHAVQCFVFERVHCIPPPASSMDVVTDMAGERRSLSERLIFQSLSENFSLQPEEELERKVWSSLKDDD